MSPVVPILGRIIQVVLLDCGLLMRLGGGVGVLDHTEGVVCFWGLLDCAGLAMADAKERVLCLAPGFRELAAAIW